jgi:hypothetical protein
MNYRIYTSRVHHPPHAAMDGIISPRSIPGRFTLRGRFVVPSGRPSRRPLYRILPWPLADGFSGLVRTLKRTLLPSFYDLCRRIRYSTRHFRLTARLAHPRHDVQKVSWLYNTRHLGRTSVALSPPGCVYLVVQVTLKFKSDN